MKLLWLAALAAASATASGAAVPAGQWKERHIQAYVRPTRPDGFAFLGTAAAAAAAEEPSGSAPRSPAAKFGWGMVSLRMALYSGMGLLVGASLIGLIWLCRSRRQAAPPATREEVEALRKQLLADLEELAATESTLAEPAPKSASSEPAAPTEEPPPPKAPVDYDVLMRTACQKFAQSVGPKVAKGVAVKNILDGKVDSFAGKARNFLMKELNHTAGSVLEAIDAEEAMLMLDWNDSVASNFPPLAVLIAGILSPTILTLNYVAHLTQVLIVLLPVVVLSLWALYVDRHSTCYIPGIYAWAYVQAASALTLLIAHSVLALKIKLGQKELAAKKVSIQERLEKIQARTLGGEVAFGQIRELFACHSVLLQHALLVEDGIRRSFWYTLVGAGTVVSILITAWTFAIVLGWTFVPGVVAFHPNAEEVARQDFCGAWATVFAARLSCVLYVLFFFVNIATVAKWVSDMLVNSKTYSKGIIDNAKKMDDGMMGVPVAQLLVKALILRGNSETAGAQLAITIHEKDMLERERAELQKTMATLDKQIESCETTVQKLKPKVDTGQGGIDATMKTLEDPALDTASWKLQGAARIRTAEEEAAQLEEATTAALEEMVSRITTAASQVQESQHFKTAVAGATAAAEAGRAKASAAAAQLQEADVLGRAGSALQDARAQAADAATQLQQSEAFGRATTAVQGAATQASARAKKAAKQAAAAAQAPASRD